MSDNYFFHKETKLFCMVLDDELAVMWEDREEDIDFVKAYVPIHDIVNNRVLLVEHDDFYDDFFQVDEDFFNELELYALDLDDIQVKKLKDLFLKTQNK